MVFTLLGKQLWELFLFFSLSFVFLNCNDQVMSKIALQRH